MEFNFSVDPKKSGHLSENIFVHEEALDEEVKEHLELRGLHFESEKLLYKLQDQKMLVLL